MDTNLDLIAAVAPYVVHLRISAVERFVVALGPSGLESLAGVLGYRRPRIQNRRPTRYLDYFCFTSFVWQTQVARDITKRQDGPD
jgi:hypothetical protein